MPPNSPDDPANGGRGQVQAAVLSALLASQDNHRSPEGLIAETVASAENLEPEVLVSGPSDHKTGDHQSGVSRRLRSIVEWSLVLGSAFLVSIIVRQYLFQAFYIESESMETTLVANDRVLVNRLSYTWGEVGRGDVVVFARLPSDPGQTRDLIKRVIGLPGDEVEGRNNSVYINGLRLNEPYLAPENMTFGDFGPLDVPDGELFVMGDNRDNSIDSRRFGTIDISRAAGRAFVTFWPPDHVGSL